MDSKKELRIRARAYAIWMEEGRPHGKHEEHWHRAAREIDQEDRPRASSRRAASATGAASTGAAKAPRRGSTGASARVATKPEATAKKPAAARPRRGSGASAS
jgi:hypothetical protein